MKAFITMTSAFYGVLSVALLKCRMKALRDSSYHCLYPRMACASVVYLLCYMKCSSNSSHSWLKSCTLCAGKLLYHNRVAQDRNGRKYINIFRQNSKHSSSTYNFLCDHQDRMFHYIMWFPVCSLRLVVGIPLYFLLVANYVTTGPVYHLHSHLCHFFDYASATWFFVDGVLIVLIE